MKDFKVEEIFKQSARYVRRIDDKCDIFVITRFHCEHGIEDGWIEIMGGTTIFKGQFKEFEYSVDGNEWELLERSDNSEYAVQPTASPKFPSLDDVCKGGVGNLYREEIVEVVYNVIKKLGNFG